MSAMTMMAKNLCTEGHNKATKYWPLGRCGKKAALCPWLAWVGKLLRQNATYLALKQLKAAVKVSLFINMSYAEVWSLTKIGVQITQDILPIENPGHANRAEQF